VFNFIAFNALKGYTNMSSAEAIKLAVLAQYTPGAMRDLKRNAEWRRAMAVARCGGQYDGARAVRFKGNGENKA
jgi:hypothetical protein